jgi:hypothetical protein
MHYMSRPALLSSGTPCVYSVKCNYRAENDGVECRAFHSFGVGHVPKCHVDMVCRRVPKRHTVQVGKL